ncbi:MAG: PEP/pyruvate-binding domain-containing protein [Kofleriaceae bacterium]
MSAQPTPQLVLLAALVAGLGACADDACELGADVPAYAHRLGCPADRKALGAEEDDNVFAHTTTINVLVDREDPAADGGVVYFFDPDVYFLHYDFAREFLEHPDRTPVGSLTEFNLLNYRREERRFFLGKLVHYRDSDLVTFELAAGDRPSAALLVEGFRRIAAATDLGARLSYRPTSNSQVALVAEVEALIPTVDAEAVYSGQQYQALNRGVGFGTLRFVRTDALAAAALSPTDLVVLDRVPNDVAMVSGIVTAEFQTPLAHVGILARTRGTPNMALRDAWDDPRLRALEGELVRLEVGPQDFTVEVGDPVAAQAYWDGLRPAAPQVPVHDSTPRVLFDVGQLGVDASIRIGAKAAHLGELTRVAAPGLGPLPTPAAPLAIPFGYYVDHLASSGAGAMIEALLTELAATPLPPAALAQRLFAIRWAIYRAPVAPALLDELLALAATRWGDATPLRFRSSTNVEDVAEFTGAGLYTSAGATPADGAAALGRALKVVWASVWNHQGFVEREFYRIDHREVRMAVLVHPAQVDELANGVALTINEFSALRPAYYVNAQLGEVSVTNPTGDAVPEQLLYYPYYETPEYEVITRSSLMAHRSDWTEAWPTTDAVLTDAEAATLGGYLTAIAGRFRTLYGSAYAVDVEWKLMPGRTLLIKQARPLRVE